MIYNEFYIRYKNPEDAKQALEKMNGFELAGRTVCYKMIYDLSFISQIFMYMYIYIYLDQSRSSY